MRPMLYVCAPWQNRTGPEAELTDEAIRVAIGRGWAPVFTPYVYNGLLDDNDAGERAAALSCCESFIDKADAVLVVGHRFSKGMRADFEAWIAKHPVAAWRSTYFWPGSSRSEDDLPVAPKGLVVA